MPDRLVVLGAGGHAKVVVEAALLASPGREILILDDAKSAVRQSILGIPVSGGCDQLSSVPSAQVIVAIGDNATRARLLAWVRDQNHTLETVVHPNAIIASSVRIGCGVFVSASATVIGEACIGAGAIVNTGATIDHDCVIGHAAHVAPGAHLCGNVQVGARTLVGVGAAIAPGVSICDDVIVGAGAVVVRDISAAGVFAGNPARALH